MKKIIFVPLILIIAFSSCVVNEDNSLQSFFSEKEIMFTVCENDYVYFTEEEKFICLNGDYKGMQVIFKESICNVSFEGYTMECSEMAFPQLNYMRKLFAAFKNNFTSSVQIDDDSYCLPVDSCRFLVYYNKDLKQLKKLTAETVHGTYVYTASAAEDIN